MPFKYKKIPYWKLIPIIMISIIFYKLVDNAEILFNGLRFFFSILSYLFWAFVIAYVLNPLMVFIEKKLKVKRALSILLIYVMFSGFVVFSIMVLGPILADSLTQLVQNFPGYVEKTQGWAEDRIAALKIIDNKYDMGNYFKNNIDGVFNNISGFLSSFLNSLFNNALNLTSAVFKLFLAIIISIYLLYDKDSIIVTLKRTLHAFLSKKDAERIIAFGRRINSVFSRYILGKIIDSALIGIICFLGLIPMNVSYPFLISLLVGILNLIPYFGTIIGVVPAVLITLFISPIKALWVLIFLLVLGQIDGMIIAPKIIGEKIGLSPIMIMVAITIGGAVHGVVGMFISVPMMAVVQSIFFEYIDKKLEEKENRAEY